MTHVPVLLNEVLEYLRPQNGDIVLDATINGGGHSMEILKYILPDGKLVGIDQDKNVLKNLESRENIILINGNFRDLDDLLKSKKIRKLDAVLFDLGMSSNQLQNSGRGFSFKKEEPLFMTFKWPIDSGDLTAKEIVSSWTKNEIFEILVRYGEERHARKISKGIIDRRKKRSINTTFDLVGTIKANVPEGYQRRRIHFATRTFQALRIAVNDELVALEEGLSKGWEELSSGGRMAVISFHSLEDRIVKNFFREKSKNKEGQLLTKKPIQPSREEVISNPRARSAKLRAIVKL